MFPSNHTDNISTFTSAIGEKRIVVLPGSTILHLNAGSVLRMAEGFGNSNRTVYLSGEALFDVSTQQGAATVEEYPDATHKPTSGSVTTQRRGHVILQPGIK
jgi:ferric-dicitrate binding protein FerR (iron transport regulator)